MSVQFTDFGIGMKRHRVQAKVIGAGPHKVGRKRRVKRGKGIFGDIWNGIKTVGNKVGDIALNKGADILFKKVLGGKRRKRRKVRKY